MAHASAAPARAPQPEIETKDTLAVEQGSTAKIESPTHEEVACRAYELWIARGCPHGTADQDWFEAERELTSMKP